MIQYGIGPVQLPYRDADLELTDEKTWKREVGYCVTDAGADIGRAVIEKGAAPACARYDARYVKYETAQALAAQFRSSYCVKR